jgi:hypothetical protein
MATGNESCSRRHHEQGLEPAKEQIDVVVIGHAERPTPD